jgi:outer membrane cobalamin receptor
VHTPFVRSLSLSLSIFAFPTIAHAGPVTGRVIDPDARPVPGVTVFVTRDARVVASAVTDGTGRFVLHTPDEGRLELRAAIPGFRAEPRAITADAAAHDLGTINLAISAQAESVLVSAAQTEVPLSMTASSVTVMTGDELLARQAEGLQDALRFVPGLSLASAGGRGAVTGMFPRGGESDYSLVLVDGVPANAFGGGFDFAHMPAVDIDRVEVVRGPQSALYGSNAIGAVIRVITKRGGPSSGQASFEGGSFDTARLAASSSGSSGSWEWGVAAERLGTDGLNGERSAAGETIDNDDYERHSVGGTAAWLRADGAGLRGSLQYLSDERGAPGPFGSDPGGSFSGIDRVARGTDDRWLSSLAATSAAGRRARVQAQLTHGRIDGSFASLFGSSESWSRRTAARLQADLTLARGLDGSAGAELQRERAGSTFITAAGAREVPVERSLTGLFGEVRWARAARLFVTAGVRVERITRSALPGSPDAFAPRPDFTDDTVVSANPKLAAAWFFRSRDGAYTKIRGSAGTGIRPPDAFEIAFTDNPELAPERSRSFDVGIDHALVGGRLLLESTAFFNNYDDLIVAVGSFSAASRYRTDNISNARARGLEIAGTARTRWNLPRPIDVQLRVAYTLLDTEILAVDRAAGAPPPFEPGDALLRRPKHQLSIDAVIHGGPVTAFLQGGGRTSVLDVDPSFGTFGGLFRNPGYSVWTAGLSWRVVNRLSIFGRVNNLLDRSYEEALGFPALPRGFFAGVRVAAGR